MEPQASTTSSVDPAADPGADFAALRRAVLDDALLLHGLRQAAEPDGFVARVVAAGARHGLHFDACTVRAAMHAGETPEAEADGPRPPPDVAERLFGWTPFQLRRHPGDDDGLRLDWCHLDARRMVEPSFAETAARAMREPFNRVFAQSTPVETLAALPPGLPVAGLIFATEPAAGKHDGATLAAQMLAAFESNIVVADAQPIRAALNLAAEVGENRAAAWLRALVNSYAQQRFSYERRCFVMLRVAGAPDMAFVRRALPGVPWVLVTPAAVPTSHADRRGAEDGAGLILDQSEFPEALCNSLPAHFGLRLDDGAAAAVRLMAQRHAGQLAGR